MMKLFVPDIGDEIKLGMDWCFDTPCEYRNETLFDAFEIPAELRWQETEHGFNRYRPKIATFTLPADTILKFDRVYIRKGMEDYSSITFVIVDSPDKRVVSKSNKGLSPKRIRFWVKLKEARKIIFEFGDQND